MAGFRLDDFRMTGVGTVIQPLLSDPAAPINKLPYGNILSIIRQKILVGKGGF